VQQEKEKYENKKCNKKKKNIKDIKEAKKRNEEP